MDRGNNTAAMHSAFFVLWLIMLSYSVVACL